MAEVDAVSDGAAVRVTGTPPETPGANPAPRPGEMSLVGHLTELRNRLVVCLIAVIAGTVLMFMPVPGASDGLTFWEAIRNVLLQPLPNQTVQVLAPGDAFSIALRISVISGVILAMPILLYELWAFISPGLTDAERKTVRPWIPLALLFFAMGVALAYVVLPSAVGFLLGFTDEHMVANLAAGPYFDFVTTIFIAFGLVLEFPIVLYGLSRVGIVTSELLTRSRRIAILGIAIFAAAITPGTDLVSPFALGATMYLLYEGTIFFIRRSGK
jgi:sec-independent protein translocase protein TatC